jgi:4-amino-4-deoxy-L-arabinose transferase-like glycosyltransferase
LSSRTTEFRLLTLAGCAAALVPRLAHRGMFLDGVTYAAIARNLAEGRGRFWEPYYTATIYPAFHEHPPLALWLESIWFRVLGDHWLVERAYCFAAAMLTASLIAIMWRALYERGSPREPRERGDNAWLPIAFWMLAPVVSWSIVGNLLETTVCIFVTAAVAALAIGGRGPIGSAIAAGVISGLCVAAAVLSKGPVGFFPLAAPVIMALLPEHRRATIPVTAAQWTTLTLCGVALYLMPSAHDSLARYVAEQLATALSGQRETSGSSITILVALLQAVWLPMSLGIGVSVIGARGWVPPSSRDRRIAIAFTLIGLAGTLPMLVSPKQSGHYLMPAVPFYAIGAAALSAGTVDAFASRLSAGRGARVVRILALAVALGAVAAIWIPAVERDPVRVADLDRLAAVAPRGAIVGICPAANADWLLHAWMQRRFAISLDAGEPHAHDWFLKSADHSSSCPPAACVPISDPGRELTLMRCR